ncbi:toll/interleukin-1 receptor domain-containing protein [Sphingomonas pituitosa]|uniref:toll/interleukin-1 receptor domain-containing protein n=1 Tax=Sphingomonas pituitosa TaxID=99597 RepID=UPI00082D4E82|nr:toll/interleukin-1 receptor domain-containing protein [Sphingomonas pituitosa]
MAKPDCDQWDVFISHASDDKKALVRPLANALADFGVKVWYDEFSLKPGDSLQASIDKGLGKSRYGLIILSPSFIGRPWAEREFRGLTTLALAGRSEIIPLWHQIDRDAVLDFSPPLADMVAILTADRTAVDLAIQLLMHIRPDLYLAQPRSELMRRASGEAFQELRAELEAAQEQLEDFQCPHCKAPLAHRTPAPLDDAEKHWDSVDVYECGLETFGGDVRQPCSHDQKFPAFSDYTLTWHQIKSGDWMVAADPRTRKARSYHFGPEHGADKDAALAALKDAYRRYAPPHLDPG